MRDRTTDAIVCHLSEMRRRQAVNTVTHRQPLLRRLAAAHGGDIFAVTPESLDMWLDAMHVKPRTRNVYISEIGTFYRWAIKRRLTESNPALDATKVRAPRSLPRPIADDALARALDAADPRMAAWLTLMAYAGLRCCEVAALRSEDILWHLSPPTLHLQHGTKGGHERLVPLAEAAEFALIAHGLPHRGPIFPHARHHGPVTASYVSKVTATFLHELGLPWTAHTLRHWFGTTLYARTKDLRATQELMGHQDPGTTSIYVQWIQSEAADAVRWLAASRDAGTPRAHP